MMTQELINRAEVSDAIFELLAPVYSRTLKNDEEVQYRKMKTEARFLKKEGLLPSSISDTTIVREFFNRL